MSAELLNTHPTHLRQGPLLAMSPAAAAEPDGVRETGMSASSFSSFLSSVPSCCASWESCSPSLGSRRASEKPSQTAAWVLKIAGPLMCRGWTCRAVILARLPGHDFNKLRRRLQGAATRGTRPRPFLCGESRQFVQCLIFGFLFLTERYAHQCDGGYLGAAQTGCRNR